MPTVRRFDSLTAPSEVEGLRSRPEPAEGRHKRHAVATTDLQAPVKVAPSGLIQPKPVPSPFCFAPRGYPRGLSRISHQASPEARCARKSPKGIDTSSRGQRPRKPDIPRDTPTPKGSYKLGLPHAANRSDPFRVGPEIHFVPGALPPAIYLLPFQGNRNESPTSVAGEKYGLGFATPRSGLVSGWGVLRQLRNDAVRGASMRGVTFPPLPGNC